MTTSAGSSKAAPAPVGMPPQMAQKALAYLRRAVEKMKSLQSVERVLVSVERVILNRVPEKFDFSALVTAINALNLALREADEDNVREAVVLVSQELDEVTLSLIERDAVLMPYHLRRFCEDETTTLDLNALAALTSFYRALPPTEANRGKYDFVVTRLFSHAEPGRSARHRHLRISREQLAKRLTEMCAAWGEVISRAPADAIKIRNSIAQFDQFIAEVKQINQFEELISRAFFQRIRACKAQVGALLYLPEVTAASVESNVVITHRFLTLLEIENEGIHTAPHALQSLAGAYSDTYSNEPDEISTILRELESVTPHDEISQERVSRLTNLLQLADNAAPSMPLPEIFVSDIDDATFAPPEPIFSVAPDTTIEDETLEDETIAMDEDLRAFAAAPENQSLIAAYCTASAEARRLDLHSFLSPLPNGDHEELKGETKARRAALDLIFQADKIVQTELRQEREPRADIEACVENLFDQLGQVSDDVRDRIKVAQKHEQNVTYEVLLHVYNQLMTARLRLQSALVRRHSSENAEADAPADASISAEVALAEASVAQPPVTDGNKSARAGISLRQCLVIAAIVLLIAAVGINFAVAKKQISKDDAGVERLDRGQLPHGDYFTEAKLHQDLMICVVTQKWKALAEQEQKEKLQGVFAFGQERGAQRVMLIDLKGTTVGFATKEEVFAN